MPVLQPNKIHRIDEDILKVKLLSAAASSSYSLTDPIVSSRSSNSKFVVTSYPARPVEYPIIVVEMLNSSGQKSDAREDLFEYMVNFRFLIRATTKTHCHNIINGISEYLERDWRTLAGLGLAQIQTTGSSGVIWEPDTETYSRTLSIEGLAYSKYVAS